MLEAPSDVSVYLKDGLFLSPDEHVPRVERVDAGNDCDIEKI